MLFVTSIITLLALLCPPAIATHYTWSVGRGWLYFTAGRFNGDLPENLFRHEANIMNWVPRVEIIFENNFIKHCLKMFVN